MQITTGTPTTILAFLADTSLLVVVAYLMARGPMLELLFRDELTHRQAIHLGLSLGAVGLLEALFPDARFSYATHTLFVTFAAIAGGLRVGLIAAVVVSLGAVLRQTPALVIGTIFAVILSAFLGKSVRRLGGRPARLLGGFVVGALAQACRLVMHALLAGPAHPAVAHRWISLPANGFGVMLLVLVVSDAQVRAASNRLKLEAERLHTLASRAQLAALRARLNPHFLFNTLNSIAELCEMAPQRAEMAVLRLSQLMRRSLVAGAEPSASLGEELEAVRTYLAIEQERLGERLRVEWEIESGCEKTPVPAFSLQTLVENAVVHGIAPKMEPGTLAVRVRCGLRQTLVAVQDDGVGMPAAIRRQATPADGLPVHGLGIVQQQLILLYGRSARLRLFSKEGYGTMAVFAVPAGSRQEMDR